MQNTSSLLIFYISHSYEEGIISRAYFFYCLMLFFFSSMRKISRQIGGQILSAWDTCTVTEVFVWTGLLSALQCTYGINKHNTSTNIFLILWKYINYVALQSKRPQVKTSQLLVNTSPLKWKKNIQDVSGVNILIFHFVVFY